MKSILVLFILSILISSCDQKEKDPNPGNETPDLSDFEKFTGRWTLGIVESQSDSTSEWEPRQDHYKNRKGYIIYDGKGGMGVHHVTEDYEKYAFEGSGGLDSLSVSDLRHLADNFVYFGKYRINDSLGIVEHHIESVNFQYMWGTIARRKYRFSGDTLILNPITNRYPKTRLKWIKLNDMK